MIFYLDAIMALLLALVVVSGIGIYYSIEPELQYKTIHAEAEDMMQLLSQKVDADELGLPENYSDKSYLEVIGTLWLNGNETEARNVAADLLDGFDRRCVELSFEGDVIYNRTGCSEEGRSVAVANRVASGYTPGKKPEGYMTRIILNKEKVITSDYIYFGGYEGDGNVTKKMSLPFIDTALEARMELNAGSNFTLYVNGNYAGDYSPGDVNMSSDTFYLCNETEPDYCDLFQENNTIDFIFSSNNARYVGGGYIVVRYNTTEMKEAEPVQKYDFPGIEGVINLYTSFYIPGTLQKMDAFLHYTSNWTVFMNIGNATVYTGSTPEDVDQNVTINDTEISSALSAQGFSYADLSNKTVPLRLGIQNVSYVMKDFDIFSVSSVAGSTNKCIVPSDPSDYDCMDGGDYFHTKITVIKRSNKDFIDIILSVNVSRIGLVAYQSNTVEEYCHNLSTDNSSLKGKVDEWSPNAAACLCCGINSAVDKILDQSYEDKQKFMVVMADAKTTTKCDQQGTGSATEDAIQAACDAWNNHGIKVYTIAYGPDADNDTLMSMADCGHGEYYFSNLTQIEEIYKLVAIQILNASYQAQTVKYYEGYYGNITLYPDSYINFTYTPAMEQPDYGEIEIKVEGPRFGGVVESPKNGTFFVPNGTRVLDARITSYSSQYWTDRALIDNGTDMEYIYRLWDYVLDYKEMGDPYEVYIPVEMISTGLNNVSIDTGGKADNTTGGSPDNRVIYTLAVDILSEYSGVFSKTQGFSKEFYYDLDLDGNQDGYIEMVVGNGSDPWDPDIDAIDNAMVKIMDKLNFYEDTGADDGSATNPIDVYPRELSFDTVPIGGIPWLWGPSIFTLKVW